MSPSPAPPLHLAIRSSAPTTTTTTTPSQTTTTRTTAIITPATNCTHGGIYVLPQIVGGDEENKNLLRDGASIFAVPNWNQTLVGMTACCGGGGSVHVGGPENCDFWCLIPDEFLYENGGTDNGNVNDASKTKRRPASVAAGLMESCVKREGNITEPLYTMWQVKDVESGASASRFGLEGGKVMSMKKMVVAGVVGWGVVFGGLFCLG